MAKCLSFLHNRSPTGLGWMPNLYYYTKKPPLYIVFNTSTVVYIILNNIKQVLLCICRPYISPNAEWICKSTQKLCASKKELDRCLFKIKRKKIDLKWGHTLDDSAGSWVLPLLHHSTLIIITPKKNRAIERLNYRMYGIENTI